MFAIFVDKYCFDSKNFRNITVPNIDDGKLTLIAKIFNHFLGIILLLSLP